MWKAILIVSLNLACTRPRWQPWRRRSLIYRTWSFRAIEPKPALREFAAVWQRTADAIKAYMATPHFKTNQSPLLFTTTKTDQKGRLNRPLKIGKITDKIRRLRKAAGLDGSVVFDGIRDLFRTSAGAENIVAIKWAMGHTLGEDDTYAFRDPKETAGVMRKVEMAVFGSNSG